MISSRQLEAFVTLVDKRTMTSAAEAMNLSQPTVSKLIRNLEREIQLRLFVRERQRLVATPEALILYDSARRMFSDIRNLQGLARELQHLKAGRLDLIAVNAIGTHLLVDVLAQLTRAMPEVVVSLSATVERDLSDWLVTSQADWGFCMIPVDRSDVSCEAWRRVAASCAIPANHPLTQKTVIRPRDLEGEAFISFRRDGYMRAIVDRVFVEHGVRRRLNVEVYGSEQACAMVGRGMGVSIVEPFSLYRYVERGEVVSRPFEPIVGYTIYRLRNRQRPPSIVAMRFLEIFQEILPSIFDRLQVRELQIGTDGNPGQ